MRSERSSIAREEAAHAVAAIRAGRRLVDVGIDPGLCKLADDRDYQMADAVIRIVGPLSCDRWPSRRCDVPGFISDRTAAEIICEEIGGDGASLLKEAEARAAALLQDPDFVAEVDRLADELLRCGEMSGHEVEHLLGVEHTLPPWQRRDTPPKTAPWREAVAV